VTWRSRFFWIALVQRTESRNDEGNTGEENEINGEDAFGDLGGDGEKIEVKKNDSIFVLETDKKIYREE